MQETESTSTMKAHSLCCKKKQCFGIRVQVKRPSGSLPWQPGEMRPHSAPPNAPPSRSPSPSPILPIRLTLSGMRTSGTTMSRDGGEHRPHDRHNQPLHPPWYRHPAGSGCAEKGKGRAHRTSVISLIDPLRSRQNRAKCERKDNATDSKACAACWRLPVRQVSR